MVLGLLAHVDAGKTTLSEAMLYTRGQIKSVGRVDHQDAYLDNDAQERERGITIFSKQARMGDITLLDTPGHVDFSAEMERTLQVLDYAILVISGTDGVQGHTRTLWRLLRHYHIPTFLFINKMDLAGADHEAVQTQLKKELSDGCVDFTSEPYCGGGQPDEAFYEDLAVCKEELLTEYMDSGASDRTASRMRWRSGWCSHAFTDRHLSWRAWIICLTLCAGIQRRTFIRKSLRRACTRSGGTAAACV